MPRRPRIHLDDVPLHIVQRGHSRAPCFFAEEDYFAYLHWLGEALIEHQCTLHAYALMTNHVHLLLTPATTGCVSTMMQSLGRRYVRYINDRYRRTGTLWEGRFKACPVQSDDHLLRCYRYIERKRPATTPTSRPHLVLSLSCRALPSPKWAAGCRYPGCA